MTLEEAIVTALEHENRVRDYYAQAARECADPRGRGFFEMMAKDEQGHVEYLTAKLAEWRDEGVLKEDALGTIVPSADLIQKGLAGLQESAGKGDMGQEAARLHAALRMEQEVSEFYRGLVANLPEGRDLFRRFLEIEDGHTAVVQAEIDVVQRTGFFYDFMEFNQEE